MGSSVYYQFITCFKCFWALNIRKRLLASVGSSVYYQMMTMPKTFWHWWQRIGFSPVGVLLCTNSLPTNLNILHRTLITLKLSLTSMDSSVYYQFTACLNASFSKLITRNWFLTCMGSSVYYQFTTCFKYFRELITRKWFLTSVGSSVYHQMMTLLKC